MLKFFVFREHIAGANQARAVINNCNSAPVRGGLHNMKTRAKLLNVSIIAVCFTVAFGFSLPARAPAPRPAQHPAAAQTQTGQWSYIGSDAAHTRYSPLNQIN